MMKIREIVGILNADVLCCEEYLDNLVVAAGGADLMNDVLAAATEGAVLLTGVTSEHVLRTAKIAGVAVVVFVRGKETDPSIVDLARSYQLPLLRTHYSLFVACGRLYMEGLRGLDGSW